MTDEVWLFISVKENHQHFILFNMSAIYHQTRSGLNNNSDFIMIYNHISEYAFRNTHFRINSSQFTLANHREFTLMYYSANSRN